MNNHQVHRAGVLAVVDQLLDRRNTDVQLRGRAGTKTCRMTVNCIPVHVFASTRPSFTPFIVKDQRGLENKTGICVFVKLQTDEFFVMNTTDVPLESNGKNVLTKNLMPFKNNWKLIDERSR